MKVDVFEKTILKKGLRPIHLFMGMGSQVKWFVCLKGNCEGARQYDLVVYDCEGKAWVLTRYPEKLDADSNFDIRYIKDKLYVNGWYLLHRDECLDLNIGE